MNSTFESLYKQLGRVTGWTLAGGIGFLVLALVCALLGLPDAVRSFNQAAIAVGYVFAILLVVFLLASIIGAIIRWIDRRSVPKA